MNYLKRSNQTQSETRTYGPRYDVEKDVICTFNLSGQINYSFSKHTLVKFKESKLYENAFKTPHNKLYLDDNNFIYLDLCPQTFRHIHDFMKGYKLNCDQMSYQMKERLMRDAKLLNLVDLEKEVSGSMPDFSDENIKYWCNIVAKSIISSGIKIEHIYKCISESDLPYPLTSKLTQILETDEDVRHKVTECVKSILKHRCQEGSPIDNLILSILSAIKKDINTTSIFDFLISKFKLT